MFDLVFLKIVIFNSHDELEFKTSMVGIEWHIMVDIATNINKCLVPSGVTWRAAGVNPYIQKFASIQEKIFELRGVFCKQTSPEMLALQWRSPPKTNVSEEHVDL